MRDKVTCTIKVNINRINLMLRSNYKRNDTKLVAVDLNFEKPCWLLSNLQVYGNNVTCDRV